jgi:hypothetical protein
VTELVGAMADAEERQAFGEADALLKAADMRLPLGRNSSVAPTTAR